MRGILLMNNKLNCKLKYISKSPHISGIITGYIILEKQNNIDLEIINDSKNRHMYPHEHMVEVVFNNEIIIAYDLLDGYNISIERLEKYLIKCNYYFKRSYDYENNKNICGGQKIIPLGLNYHVTIKGNPIDKNWKNVLKFWAKKMTGDKSAVKMSEFYVDKFEDLPKDIINEPKVLFYTRVWDPEGEIFEDKITDRNIIEERKYINNMRVDIIRKLKKELKENFNGGLSSSKYAITNYPDCVINADETNRNNYIEMVKKSDICIASMGLHKSIGWKFAEYVASSKAIVSEKLYYDIPGDFKCNINYIEYNSSDECVKKVIQLCKDKKRIANMQRKNYEYYNKFVRPDKQVLYTIEFVLNRSNLDKYYKIS